MKTLLPAFAALCGAVLLPVDVQAQQSAAPFHGRMRVRHEMERPLPSGASDQATFLRSHFAVGAEVLPGARAFVQLQDARVLGERSPVPGATNGLHVHQGYFEVAGPVLGRQAALRVGRQEMALGNERLMGAVGWSNMGRALDAARVDVAVDANGGRLTLFGARPALHASGTADVPTILGANLVHGGLAGWVLHDRGAAFRSFADVLRTTAGVHLAVSTSHPLSGWVEGAWQTGSQQGGRGERRSISAWLAAWRVAWKPELGRLVLLEAGADVLSGDGGKTDDSYQAFHTLYGTNHKWYGLIDLFLDPSGRTGDRGLADFVGSARLDLGRDIILQADGHHFRTAAARSEKEGRALGWELDLTLPVDLGRGREIQFGYSLFRNGAAAPLANLGDAGETWHWGYVQATVNFPGGAQ